MGKTVYFLRHGSTGLDGRFVGSSDLPIIESSHGNLQKCGQELLRKDIESIFCSPMLRCRQSLNKLGLECAVEFMEDLREIDFGEWEQKSFDDVSVSHPKEVEQWCSGSGTFTFPGGERISDFLQRVQNVRDTIETHTARSILIVSHGGVIRHLVCSFLGLAPDNYLLFDIKAGSYSAMNLYSEGGVLTALNAR